MHVVGIDLSGPSNVADSAVAVFRATERGLVLRERLLGAGDAALAAWKWSLDAPAWIHPADPPWHPHDMAC
jgi:hypothetical protein